MKSSRSFASYCQRTSSYRGYDISPDAHRLAQRSACDRLSFHCEDLLQSNESFDLLLAIDVIEHIPDYRGFITQCRQKATHVLYHIPLEVNTQSVTRASFAFPLSSGRNSCGHIHFFTAESAIAALEDTGHRIVDVTYTDGCTALASLHPSFKRTIANIPRGLVALGSRALAARLLGGYSLLVLCE